MKAILRIWSAIASRVRSNGWPYRTLAFMLHPKSRRIAGSAAHSIISLRRGAKARRFENGCESASRPLAN